MLQHRDKYRAGFLHGRSGVYAVHAVISAAAGKSDEVAENARAHAAIWYGSISLMVSTILKYLNIKRDFSADACEPHFDGCDELLFGRAGYVCGALWIRKHLPALGFYSDLVKPDDVRR